MSSTETKKLISNDMPEKERHALLYLKQIGAINTKKEGINATRKFNVVYARFLTSLIVERNGIDKKTMQDGMVLAITAMSQLAGAPGISEDMLLEASNIMFVFADERFKEIKYVVEALRKEILEARAGIK